jgi:hypothetical protein
VTVPTERRAALVDEHHLCIAANVALAHELSKLVDLTRARSVPLLLLKGMAMLASPMGEGERSMGDVDVLVPASRWAEICEIAARAGWRPEDVQGRGYTAGHDYVRAFTTRRGVTIEIHRFVCEQSLFSFDYEGADGIFARARLLPSGVYVPDDTDLFLTLAAHAAKHTFELPLRSFLDGLVLLRQNRIRLGQAATRARAWHMAVAFRMWMSALCWLAPGQFDEAIVEAGLGGLPFPLDSGRARLGRFVWSRTRHASAWQRFLRLAWLTDGPRRWARHVATRAGIRSIDLVDDGLRRWSGVQRG